MSNEKIITKLLAVQEEIEDALELIRSEGQIQDSLDILPDEAQLADFSANSAKRLAIVVGHTRRAPGAFGVSPISQSEYPWNSDLAQRMKAVCEEKGILCGIFFRDGIGISGAYANARGFRPDAVMELHFNAATGAVEGTETLHGSFAGSADFSQVVQDAMIAVMGVTDRGPTPDRGLKPAPPHNRGVSSVNALSDIPSCLIEPFFGDNARDAARGHERKDQLARALVEAFETYVTP